MLRRTVCSLPLRVRLPQRSLLPVSAVNLQHSNGYADLSMSMASHGLSTERRRVLYHAHRRGWKENDYLVGSFADKYLANMTEEEVEEFKVILDAPDPELFRWITRRDQAPPHIPQRMLQRMQRHVDSGERAWNNTRSS